MSILGYSLFVHKQNYGKMASKVCDALKLYVGCIPKQLRKRLLELILSSPWGLRFFQMLSTFANILEDSRMYLLFWGNVIFLGIGSGGSGIDINKKIQTVKHGDVSLLMTLKSCMQYEQMIVCLYFSFKYFCMILFGRP